MYNCNQCTNIRAAKIKFFVRNLNHELINSRKSKEIEMDIEISDTQITEHFYQLIGKDERLEISHTEK